MGLVRRAELLCEHRCGVGAPGDVGGALQPRQSLQDARESGGLRLQILDALLERQLSVDGSQVLGDGGDRSPVQVQAAFRIAPGRKEEGPAAACASSLVVGQGNLSSRDGGQHDKGHGERFALVISGELALEVSQPRGIPWQTQGS
jgi:hypothetical protein